MLSLLFAAALAAGPNVGVGLSADRLLDPALPYELRASVWNSGDVAATGVVLTIELPDEVTVKTIPDVCTAAPGRITCAVGTVPTGSFSATATILRLVLVAPDRREGRQLLHRISFTSNEPERYTYNDTYTWPSTLVRTFVVDNTSDSGSGSLRAAIEEANSHCGTGANCKVAFRIPASGVVTIAPESPLPAITGSNIAIDGTTQTRMFGDTNPAGPEVFLDGSKLREGNGLVVKNPCEADVRGLAIGNFPMYGVVVQPEILCPVQSWYNSRHVAENYIGVDPTGAHAAPNYRGVLVNDISSIGSYYPSPMTIDHNVISGNVRSGVFIERGPFTQIGSNVIGLNPQHDAPLGNGASGIYVGPGGAFTDIFANYIAFNGDFGIAVDRKAEAVDIHPNSIFANWQIGIDVGLDGPTPQSDTPAPEILSATYDPATDKTEIVMAFHDDVSTVFGPTVHVYASDAPHRSGYGDGQYYLGTVRPADRRGTTRFAAAGDWRGKWVCATMSHNNYYGWGFLRPASELPDTHTSTSEFSRAVEVSGAPASPPAGPAASRR